MEVPNKINSMRFSPVLLAVFTASATLGLSNPAKAQTPDLHLSPESVAQAASQGSEAGPQVVVNVTPVVVPTVTEPDYWQPQILAQELPPDTPVEGPVTDPDPQLAPPLDPGMPPPGTQVPLNGTPEESELEFELTPTPAPDIPEQPVIEFEGLPEDPQPTAPGDVFPAPPATPPTTPPTPGAAPPAEEPRVLVAEVAVVGAEGELEAIVYQAIRTQPGQTTTRTQLQEDINSIFATGFFADVRAVPQDTPLGVRVTFEVQPNPVLRNVQVQGQQVLPQEVVDQIFAPQYGTILNLRQFQAGIQQVNQWYQANGYVLAQVVDVPQVSPDGVVTLVVAEGVIEDVQVRFLNREGEPTDEEGEPIRGRTRDFIITREFESQPGDVFNQQQIEQDLQRVFGLGIFEDVRVSLNPGQDPRQVDVVVNVIERNTGSVAAGVGFSSASGLFGTVSYQQQNLGGNNQSLGAEVQFGQRELLFDVNFTDPWIAGDPYRTAYTANIFNRRSISLIFDGGEREVTLPDEDNPQSVDTGDRPRVNRIGGGISFSRPLDEWLGLESWRGSLGFQYQRVSVRDSDGTLSPVDALGNDLSFSGTGVDDLVTFQLAGVRDRRNSALQPTSGTLLRVGTEQSVPIGTGSILFNRVRASYSQYIPVRFTRLTEGCRLPTATPAECPQTLAFNLQGGTVLGDLPPYEAFSLGGTDSVRGYDSGELGSGRSFALASVEYRFPIFAIVGGALFADFGTDLGTANNIPGNPSVVREKPGSGFGYGVGVRVQSPLGPIRVDYGLNDQGESRIHFGIGERF